MGRALSMTSSILLAATMVIVLVSLSSAAFVAGDSCDQLPTMSWNDACLQSCNFSQAWIKLCQDTLSGGPATAEPTVFALAATRQAKLRYASTVGTLDQMLGPGTLPKAERLVIEQCKEKYLAAEGLVSGIVDQLAGCDLSSARQEYLDAEINIASCQGALEAYQFLPLYTMVAADHNMTMVAYELGALVVGK